MTAPGAFAVRGVVEHGDERGRTIGFPTANLPLEHHAHLDGVWAGWIDIDGQFLAAAISVGNRSTFYGEDGFRLLEAHVLDFVGDLYGKVVTVWMCEHLREQCAFSSIDALIEQLRTDVRSTRSWAATARRAGAQVTQLASPLPFGRAVEVAAGC